MTHSTLAPDKLDAIRDYVDTHTLVHGLGTAEAACSVAAINLALTGKLTDTVPDCMSLVVGRWVIVTQDRLPEAVLNGARWKSLLPLAAGTGRDREPERLALVMGWMWERLATLQPVADTGGYGEAWATMLRERNYAAAAATAAAYAAYAASADYAAYAAASAAASAANAVTTAANAADYAANAADYAAYAAASAAASAANAAAAAANAVTTAANAADYAAYAAAYAESAVDLLERLVATDPEP